MRAFIALPLEERTATVLYEKREPLRESFRKIRWVPPINYHITLFFLGEISRSQAEEVCYIMNSATGGLSPFPVEMTGPGQFPPRGQPRVIYEGLGKGSSEAKKIYGSLQAGLSGVVAMEKRKYIPHITLGRVRADYPDRGDSGGVVHLETVTGTINGITLFESILKKDGAEYYPIDHINFKKGEE